MHSLARDLYVAIGRIQERSDVRVVELRRLGPQPARGVELAEEVRAFFHDIGALHFTYQIEDGDPPGEGGLRLRAPSSQGWWDAGMERPTTWPWRDGQHLGHPGEEVAIIEGAEEGGVLIRKAGGFAYFDSDGQATPLPDDLGWLRAGIEQRFAYGWDSPRGASPDVLERLRQEVARRTTIEASVTAIDRLEGRAMRRLRLGSLAEHEFKAITKALGINASYKKMSADERGEILAEAISDAEAFDAGARKALLKPFGGPTTKAAFEERFALGDAPPLTRVTLQLVFRTRNAKSYALGRALAARVLLDAGVAFPGVDADAVRFVPDDHRELASVMPTAGVLGKVGGKPPAATIEVSLGAEVTHDLEVGRSWESSALEPMVL